MNLLTGLRRNGRKSMSVSNPAPMAKKKTPARSGSILTLLRDCLRNNDEGGALVETAFVLPILGSLVLGIFTVGVMFTNDLDLTEATGSGAQYLQLIRTSTTDPCADTFTAIKNAAPSLIPGNITLKFSLNGTTVNGDQSDLVAGEPVSVTAYYPCNLTIYGVNFAPAGCTLTASASEYEY